ncbi:hypothetical protein XENOCAPTIV_014318 [Xenoophorus captivus]|uniref:Uncharacterized protein n=1 Tax=Xenoophorus captivus TaxID=1517983 RepID=A0ABV0RU97_9TELE
MCLNTRNMFSKDIRYMVMFIVYTCSLIKFSVCGGHLLQMQLIFYSDRVYMRCLGIIKRKHGAPGSAGVHERLEKMSLFPVGHKSQVLPRLFNLISLLLKSLTPSC